jgi:hypothetical protein
MPSCDTAAMGAEIASQHVICRSSAALLADGGVLEADELARRLGEAGVELGRDGANRLASVLDGSSAFIELAGGWASVEALLDGTTWTTQVPDGAAATGRLRAAPDLSLLAWWVLDHPLDLDDQAGAVVSSDTDEDGVDALTGPPGWLEGLDGEVVALTVTGRTLGLRRLDTVPTADPAQISAVVEAFAVEASHAEIPSLDEDDDAETVEVASALVSEVLWQALATRRSAFTGAVAAPVDDLLAAAGLGRSDVAALGPGVRAEDYRRWQQRRRMASFFDLDDRRVTMAEIVIDAAQAVADGSAEPFGPVDEEQTATALLGVLLSDPDVCRAVLGEHLERETDPQSVADFAYRVLAGAEGRLRGGAGWLAGRALDLAGEATQAEAVLTDAERSDPDHRLVCAALAAFRADRGDAAGAVAFLGRAGEYADEDLVEEVAPYAPARPRPTARRNDPCPCGSGRKYKVCHHGQERIPLADRGPWVYAKARRYLRDNRYRALHLDLAHTIARASGRGAMFLSDLLRMELVADLALCEAGVWEAFLAERHHLLPDDEALLASSWQLVERSLFEVHGPGHEHLDLRDLRTGERITVTNVNTDPRSGTGTLLFGRPLPVADTWRAYSGFLPVSGPLVDELLDALDDPDPFRLAVVTGRLLAPPRIANSDGHDLVFHELTYHLAAPDPAGAALVAAGFQDDGEGTFTLVANTASQHGRIVLSATIDGDRLVVSANSDARAAEAQALIARALPDAELVDRDRHDVDEFLDERPQPEPGVSGPLPSLPGVADEEVAAMVGEFMRGYEREWLDHEIPALGGRTPRQAAADPIGRHQLERLLATFSRLPADEIGMDPDRIRHQLGL